MTLEAVDNLKLKKEEVIWQGRPTQWVNLSTFSVCILLSLISFYLLIITYSPVDQAAQRAYEPAAKGFALAVLVFSVIHAAASYLRTRATSYVLTTERLIENRGLTSVFRNSEPLELYEVLDYQVPPARFLALVRCGDVRLITKDIRQPELVIRGVKYPFDLYQMIRKQVETLRLTKKGYFAR